MKLTEKVKNEHGVVTIDRLREIVQKSINDLTKSYYIVSKKNQKNLTLIVEYYIMIYYRMQNIDKVSHKGVLNNIELVLSIMTDEPFYSNLVDKKYEDVLWWIIYQLISIDELSSTDYSSEIVSRIIDAINCVECGEYPKSYLDSFHIIQLEECIHQLYLFVMSDFMFGDKLHF